MTNLEAFLLKFVEAAAPIVENLFIHNQRSIAIWNASDELFKGVVETMTAQQQKQAPVQEGKK
jgi:hypothetical protein